MPAQNYESRNFAENTALFLLHFSTLNEADCSFLVTRHGPEMSLMFA
jgi:hypothetical protein